MRLSALPVLSSFDAERGERLSGLRVEVLVSARMLSGGQRGKFQARALMELSIKGR
jgi:hypothetical protein